MALTLAGLALGSRWAGRRADTLSRPLLAYGAIEGIIALWALSTPILFRALPWLTALLENPASERIDLGLAAFLATGLLLLPGTFLMGATTPLVVRALSGRSPGTDREASREGGAGIPLGRLYGWNTLGGAAGALVSIFVLLPA